MPDYRYLFFDGDYFLMRLFHTLRSSRYVDIKLPNGEDSFEYIFDEAEITKSFFWAIAKYIREFYSCRLPIVAFDKHPYHKLKFLEDYKDTRHYYSEEDLVGLTEGSKEWHETNEEIRIQDLKIAAKYWCINNFPRLGIQTYYHNGYECDDLAYLFAESERLSEERSAIVSIDSDWNYWINENVDHLKPDGDCITYDAMLPELDYLDGKVSLFQYKSYIDSALGSHNDLQKTLSPECTLSCVDIVNKFINNDFSDITDKDRFDRQVESFDIKSYPDIDQVRADLNALKKINKPLSIENYRLFCTLTGFRVTESYYERTVSLLDDKMFTNVESQPFDPNECTDNS